MGTGSGMRTHSCSKRTLGVAGASRESESEVVAVERETKDGERGTAADMMGEGEQAGTLAVGEDCTLN